MAQSNLAAMMDASGADDLVEVHDEHPRSGWRPKLVFGDLYAGETVAQYRIQGKLGQGGMGTVYRVEHAALGRPCAMKVLHGHLMDQSPANAAQFEREARAAARVRHAHVVDVFDFGTLPDGRPYFVMELLPAPSLADVIDTKALTLQRAVTLARELAEALAATHAQAVVHGDVSATNVLLAEAGVKLVDFGLARVVSPGDVRPAIADIVYGTPIYIAPEVARGHAADSFSDQYSFGILLYELLTGTAPFMHEDVRQLVRMHIYDGLPELVSAVGPLPAELVSLVERCCAKSASIRFSSMREVAATLADIAKILERKGWRRWWRGAGIDGAAEQSRG